MTALPAPLTAEFAKLLDFLEAHAFDKLLYWCVPSAPGRPDATIEIQWHKQEPLPWRLKERGKLFWQSVERAHLAEALAGFGVDWGKLMETWRDTVRQQVVYARVVTLEAEEAFGVGFVAAAVKEHEDLMAALLEALREMGGNGAFETSVPSPSPQSPSPRDADGRSGEKAPARRLTLVRPGLETRPFDA